MRSEVPAASMDFYPRGRHGYGGVGCFGSQKGRSTFFGMIEVPVPMNLVKAFNQVEVIEEAFAVRQQHGAGR